MLKFPQVARESNRLQTLECVLEYDGVTVGKAISKMLETRSNMAVPSPPDLFTLMLMTTCQEVGIMEQ